MALATSGTYGSISISTAKLVDHAFRRCGKLPSTISGELMQSALDNAYFVLSNLANNRGLSLFCIQKYVAGLYAGQALYTLPVGTEDLLELLYRTSTQLTGATLSGAGYQGLDLGSAQQVTNVSAQFTAASAATVAVEHSSDGITWVTDLTQTLSAGAGQWTAMDLDLTPTARYWRLRDTSGTLAALTALSFSNAPNEVPMAPLNRTQYMTLPNKNFAASVGASKSLQYWFDKQITPRIWVWPVPGGGFDQIVVWLQRQIQDVGTPLQTLAIPQRWLEAVITLIAHRVSLEIPAGEMPPGRSAELKTLSDEFLIEAENGESDGSNIRLQPNLRGYTR
jgi:hypothetical protein